jgi:hypothetical protein
MSTQQPEALRLAAALDELLGYRGINPDVGKAAAELLRLHSVNAELLDALQTMVKAFHTYAPKLDGAEYNCVLSAKAAIAKATGDKT